MIVWSRAADLVEDIGDPDRVGHDGQARDVAEPLGERVGRRAGRDRDGHAGLDERDGRIGDGVLLAPAGAPTWPRTRARTAALPAIDGRAAVDLLEQAALVEDLEVAADGHVRHAELAHEVGDADRAVLADAVEDECLALTREHQATLRSADAARSMPPDLPLLIDRLPPERDRKSTYSHKRRTCNRCKTLTSSGCR